MRCRNFKTITLMLPLLLSQPQAFAADYRLTEVHGEVSEQAFPDWLQEPTTAWKSGIAGDTIDEHLLIKTGTNSMAEICTDRVLLRADAESKLAVSANQHLVYLQNGSILFHVAKDTKSKSPSSFYVWTNLVQARTQGATILVQCHQNQSTISVLEGSVELLNKIDHSVVSLAPGVMYLVATSAKEQPVPLAAALCASPAIPIFKTAKTISLAALIDPMQAMQHTLLRNFDKPCPSISNIAETMSDMQAKLETHDRSATATHLLHNSLTIVSVPRTLNYSIGADLRQVAQIAPGTFQFFPPEGTVQR